ncbi:uncharacterized protein TNCV_3957661 [Trichonephila clavipes]|nr:uncharacterized protein TNCV_3957661 [Trichonephila clavipes]
MTTTGRRLPILSNRFQDFKNAMKRTYRNLEDQAMQKAGGFQMLNDDDIVTSVQEVSNPVDVETDEDDNINNESSKDPSNADALSALETAMELYEQNSVLSYLTTAARENQRPYSEKTKVYNGTVKNK